LASWNGHTEIVKLLLEAKADVNLQNTSGRTALIWASREGHTEIVKLLEEATKQNSPKDSKFKVLEEKLKELLAEVQKLTNE